MSSTNLHPSTVTPGLLSIIISREEAKALIDGAIRDFEVWCRELDGTWTLRTVETITLTLRPGEWKYAAESGYPYWERHESRGAAMNVARKTSS